MTSHKKPNFFIVGAPKCGTTALDHYLRAHPDIFMAKKEMHFFGSDLRVGPQLQLYRRHPEDYLAEFNAWQGQACAGEASVWYLFSQKAAEEIKAFNPDARIIIMLREPTAMLYSLYSAFLADGNEPLPTFKEALAAENDRRLGQRLGRQTYLTQGLVYRETARFSEQVKRYFDVFGRERVLVIIYDDFSSETAAVFGRALEFLGVSPARVAPNFEVVNGNTNGNSSVRSRAMRTILNDRLLRSTAISLRTLLPLGIFTVMKKTWIKLNEFNCIASPTKREPLDSELQRSLCLDFAPEVERLSALLGRDLTHWSKPRQTPQPRPRLNKVQVPQNSLDQAEFEAT